ncbi:hypothetical protein Tco_0238569 [Tanacetum coccineum]
MGDENPIRTLEDYFKPSHEGYRNTIELPVGNNVVPLRSDTIRLVQNGCSFHGLRSEDPNQHLKNFLKLADLLDLDGENRERTRLRLFQFSLRDQASNWLERPSPQPQTLGTTFEARVRKYMAAFSERMERFENAIFKKREEINGRMTEMFGLLKELTTSRAPKKVLIREEAKFPVTKNVNTISLARGEEERSDKTDETLDNTIKPIVTETEIPVMEAERSNETKNKPIKKAERKEVEEVLSSRPVEYYLKHRINEKLIEGLVDNNRFNESLSRPELGRIGGLKHVNALVDQGFDVNVMPCSTYMKLTNDMLTKTDIRLSLASYSYIYPLGIAEDVLVEFDKGTITLRSGKSKISFHRIPNSPGMTEKGVKNDIEPIAPTMTMNRLVLECEEKIKLYLERGMEFNQWRSKNFKGKHPTLITTKGGMKDEGEVT